MIKLITLVLFLILWYACGRKNTTDAAASSTTSLPERTDTTQWQQSRVDFQNDIQPILKSHCMPCHFPGGKLYEKLPFDNPQTIIDHPTGIFKRIKDPDEIKKLKGFMEQSEG